MSKGKRYDGSGSLNYKKVFATIIAIIVIIMFILIVKNLIAKAQDTKNTVAINYYALYADDKWGIINTNGDMVIEPMYQEMIIVLDSSKDVFLCTYDVNEDTGEYKTKVVNSKNEEIYTDYDMVEVLDNYDSSGNAWYEENIFRVKKDGKYGLISIDGKEILKPEYESIEALKGIENSLIVTKDGKEGLVNVSGVTIINSEYKQIINYGDDYKDGYITVDSEDNYGLVSYTGSKILENKYEKIDQIVGTNYFVIEEDGEQKLIDSEGKEILTEGYDEIIQINTEGIVFKKDKKYGFMGYDGETKIEAEYEDLERINSGILKAKKDGKYGVIDLSGTEKLSFEFEDIYYNKNSGIYIAEDSNYNSSIMDTELNVKLTGILSEFNEDEGYMKVKIDDEYKYYNFKFEEKDVKDILSSNTLFVSKKDGKYGFVDKEGNVVVDYIYDEAQEQNKYGYAAVKKGDKWGAIDSEGNVVVEPKYTLENNLVIDFIGKWHLGQDLNMNYYCEK